MEPYCHQAEMVSLKASFQVSRDGDSHRAGSNWPSGHGAEWGWGGCVVLRVHMGNALRAVPSCVFSSGDLILVLQPTKALRNPRGSTRWPPLGVPGANGPGPRTSKSLSYRFGRGPPGSSAAAGRAPRHSPAGTAEEILQNSSAPTPKMADARSCAPCAGQSGSCLLCPGLPGPLLFPTGSH